MKIEPKIVLPYENLPNSNNELIKSLKILQNTIKYYGAMIKEIQITVDKIHRKVIELEGSPLSSFEPRKGFSQEEIEEIFKKK